jgi:hypothetical protein
MPIPSALSSESAGSTFVTDNSVEEGVQKYADWMKKVMK